MKLVWQTFLFSSWFLPVLYSWAIPRLTLRQVESSHQLNYSKPVNHTVFCLPNGSENLFLGEPNCVLEVNSMGVLLERIPLTDEEADFCHGSTCENVITVIEDFQDFLFVCGTNGRQPKCWKLNPSKINSSRAVTESIDGSGISPYTSSQNSLSLVVDGDLYAAAPLYLDGTSLQFRRQAGYQNKLWMHDSWITEPTFISAFVARRHEDQMNEKIYVLFQEKTSDSSPEADPWISRVARLCKDPHFISIFLELSIPVKLYRGQSTDLALFNTIDKGGPKRFLQNIWTSFLKARLVCAIPGQSLYFNFLQDIFVLHSDDWRDSQVYALFSSSWNATAVCIYSLAELDDIFENANFKGYKENIPEPRPGTCVSDSRDLPIPTMHVVRNHPEMTDWVQPIQKHAPFYTSSINFTKIAVDRVQASDEKVYNVLLLATDTGTIHKILEHDSNAFIISETSLCNVSAPVLSMKLHSEKRKLFVGYPEQMSVLDLQRCQDYNTSCEDCVLARDPYCAWTENGCTSQIKGGIQNIATGEPHICFNNSASKRLEQDVPSSFPTYPIVRTVPKGYPFYLSCPISSHHATYSWEHRGESKPCQRTQADCLYLIPAVSAHDYGTYNCVSKESNYKKMVKVYQLHGPSEPQSSNRAFKLTALKEWMLTVFTALLISTQ